MSTAIAYNRFGLGRRVADPDLPDPRAWLLAQVTPTVPLPRGLGQQPTTGQMLEATRLLREERKDQKAAAEKPGETQMAAMTNLGSYYVSQMGTRLQAALVTETPFAERLVHFWSNHFAISADKVKVRALGGPYEQDAIRPHVGGYFSDMLLAVAQHPAMLLYLDNEQSIGPSSMAAERRANRAGRKFGLNENLAREILELHTLGVRSVYSQADVTELARAITGWSVAGGERTAQLRGEPGRHGFAYYAVLHEPGARTVLGRTYAAGQISQGVAILKDIATHPATARFIATKLARHFISDEPPASAVAKLEAAFLSSRGHLPAVYKTLITMPESWVPDLRKFKTPWEYTVSALRLTNVTSLEPRRSFQMLRTMGQPTLAPGSPAGWPDTAMRWVSSDGIAKRLSFAATLSARAPATFDARALATKLFGSTLTQTTETELQRAESGTQALTLLLASPEFMRR
jgi:uncharacterized protein (DUF1800 family)